MQQNYDPIITKTFIDLPLENVWEALTKPELMRQWFFHQIPDFVPEVGFYTEFPVDAGERVFVHQWTVTEVEEPNFISVLWKFQGYPGESLVTFSLDAIKNGTSVTLKAEVLQPFPQDIPEFKRESGVEGWDYFINKQLPSYFKE